MTYDFLKKLLMKPKDFEVGKFYLHKLLEINTLIVEVLERTDKFIKVNAYTPKLNKYSEGLSTKLPNLKYFWNTDEIIFLYDFTELNELSKYILLYEFEEK